MQNCVNCGHQNRPGVVYCENCGASLLGDKPLSTKSIDSASEEEKAQLGIDSSVLTDVKVQGVSAFSMDDTLRLEIEGSPEPIIFKPKTETIFGRRDPATGAMPDVDLTPFAGYRMGVSRRHAAIRQGEEQSLNIWDLGSSNGTYLNGQKLTAHRPYRLHDGDQLRLGQMMVRIRFQVGSEGVSVGAAKPSAGKKDDKKSEAKAGKAEAATRSAGEKPPITDELTQAVTSVAQQAKSTEPTPSENVVEKATEQAKSANDGQPAKATPDKSEKSEEQKPAEPPVEVQTGKASDDAVSPVASPPKPEDIKSQQSEPQPAQKQDGSKIEEAPDQSDSGSNLPPQTTGKSEDSSGSAKDAAKPEQTETEPHKKNGEEK